LNIIVTNDDGLHTPGIWHLAQALTDLGNVTVVAPDREQSGVGMGITFHNPVRISEAMSRIPGVKAYMVEGTPADSVILAVQAVPPLPVDLVVSGINEGANTGHNVLVSGTVGAAFQAHFWDIPSIAVSVAGIRDWRFDVAAKAAQTLARMFKDKTLAGPMVLNVNVPNIPMGDIEGVSVTRLAKGRFTDTLQRVDSFKQDAFYFWLARGKAEWTEEPDTDIWAIKNKRISISPLHIDLSADVTSPLLAEFAPSIFRAIKP